MNPDASSPCDDRAARPLQVCSAVTLPGGWASLGQADLGSRLAAGAVALIAWVILLVAAALTPSADGHGTHEQLGLPPCHFQVVTGYPCPSCGMTTSFASFVRGDLAAALHAQVFGTVLAAITLLAALGGTLMAVTGVNLGMIPARIFLDRTLWIFVLVGLALSSWALKAFAA